MKSSLRQSTKSKLKPSSSKDRLDQTDVPPRESIIDRLLRFLRSRPTIESLYERGIYKRECPAPDHPPQPSPSSEAH